MHTPHIRPERILPELTPKAIILGLLLSMILAGANAYLGLFAGLTVSASIPASVISMAILRLFKQHNILENNAVQTAASAGESLAAGVIFTFPALLLMGYWQSFNYLETTLIAMCGGVLGVLFTIPLRRSLIVEQNLKFPEGVATAEVLKSGEEGGNAIKLLLASALAGAVFKFSASGARLWHEVLDLATIVKGRGFLYFGMNLSPALMAVGYIVGLHIAILVFIGGAISWWLAIPAYIAINGAPEGLSAVDAGYTIWSSQIRYLGVGAMIVGGLWALVSIRSSLMSAFREGMNAFKKGKKAWGDTLRTDLDTPMSWVLIGIGVLIVPIFIIYLREINSIPISGFMAIIMVIAGFLFSAVAGYMAGLVGSSNNPISGVTIATILTSSLILMLLLGSDSSSGAAGAILIGAVVCCAAAIAGDNMQDLKAGYELGATPYKQQIMQVAGVIAAALTIAPILTLLNNAYGFGAKTIAHPNALAAPQATLMQSVAQGVFGKGLPWGMVTIGAIIGIAIIIVDVLLEKRQSNFRVPILAVAVGLYLPFELDSAIMLGGLIAYAGQKFYQKGAPFAKSNTQHEESTGRSQRSGLLFASGLITGEALVGILLAIPVTLSGKSDILSMTNAPLGGWFGLLCILGVCYWLYTVVKQSYYFKG